MSKKMFNIFRLIMNFIKLKISIFLNLIFVPNLLKQPCQFLLLLPLVAHVHNLSYDLSVFNIITHKIQNK